MGDQLTIDRLRYSLRHHGALKTLSRAILGLAHWIEGAVFDYRLGTDTNTIVTLDRLKGIVSKNRRYGVRYQPSHPRAIRRLISKIAVRYQEYAFIDFGSEKGRAILVAAEYPFQKIIGVDFSPELQAIAAANIGRACPHRNIELVLSDAADYVLPDVPAVLFFFNPFHHAVMEDVLQSIKASLERAPRDLWAIYYNPMLRYLFDEKPFLKLLVQQEHFALYRNRASL